MTALAEAAGGFALASLTVAPALFAILSSCQPWKRHKS